MYTLIPNVEHLFQLIENYFIEEMTLDELDSDMDSSSSIFHLLKPLDWEFKAQVCLILVHGA